jgi:hypothetical protein
MNALLEVFYQPGKVFESLPERNYAWVMPLLAICLGGVLGYWLLPHYIGAENIARQQLQAYAKSMPPEQMQAAIARASSPAQTYMSFGFAFFGSGIMMLLVSGLMMIFATMTSKPPRYGSMLAMVSLAWFPYLVVATLMTWLVLAISPDPTSLDLRNLLATNVGAFFDRNTTSKGLYAFLTSLDILTFAEVFLLSLGFSKVTKAKFGFALGVVLVLWFVTVLFKMGLSLIFG